MTPEEENKLIKQVVSKVLSWMEHGGDASHDLGAMHPRQVGQVVRDFLSKEGVDLSTPPTP